MTTLSTANGLNCGHWVDPNIETHLQLKEMFVTKNRCFYSGRVLLLSGFNSGTVLQWSITIKA